MRVSEYTENPKSIDFLITADESCMHNYKLSFMASLIACFPKDILPNFLARFVEKKFFSSVSHNNGNAEIALLSLRKIEAFLSDLGFEVVVCPPSEVESFNPKAYLVSTIDPFGIGPASSTMIGISRRSEPFNKFFFLRLINKIRNKK